MLAWVLCATRSFTATKVDEAEGPLDISDGNRDGNDGAHRQPRATVNSQLLSRVLPELGIRHT
jgi:hypothetical protein